MTWLGLTLWQWISVAAAAWCALLLGVSFFTLLRRRFPQDLAQPQGSVPKGIQYAQTVAMMPGHKESAYKHLPTYTAGMAFHLGTFLSLLLYLWFLCTAWFGWQVPHTLEVVLAVCLLFSAACGFIILAKRTLNPTLRALSVPDDYLSNSLVSLFQLLTALVLLGLPVSIWYCLHAAVLFLWIPVGKLRHLLYYFLARTQLGIFYGSRGTWPPKKEEAQA